MKKNTTDITAPPNTVGYDIETGFGRINAGQTLQKIKFPDYQIIHHEFQVLSSLATFDNLGASCNENNFFGLPNGKIFVRRYKITATNNHTIPNGYNLYDAWSRHSASNLLGVNSTNGNIICASFLNNNYLPDASFVTLDTFSTAIATLTGYTYELLDSNFNSVGWYPISLSDTAIFAYSLHVVSQTIGINDNTEISKYSIYPNPANTVIKIISSIPNQNFQVEINNLLGEKCFSGKNTSEINISNLSTGIYFMQIKNEQQIQNIKFIKSH